MGSVRAVDAISGRYDWQECLPAPVLGGVTLVPGLVEVGCGNQIIVAGMSSGEVLFDHQFPGAMFWSPASISEGTLCAADFNGRLLALSPRGTW